MSSLRPDRSLDRRAPAPARVRLASIGTAAPERVLDLESAIELSESIAPESMRPGALRALARRSGVATRRVVTDRNELYGPDAGPLGPGTARRLAGYTGAATALAVEAGAGALRESGVDASAVTHVVTVSCTGMEAPGFDQGMMRKLGVPDTARRTHVGFMGCHGAINGLAAASAFAEADPEAVVLLCCAELCSLHMHYGDRPDQMVANALFADGAAAAVVGARAGERGAPSIAGFGSKLFRETEGVMGWAVGDHGFEMTLGSEAPELLRRGVPSWMDSFLAGHGLTRGDVGGWAIHPGGPRIVRAVLDGLGLDESAGDASMKVLRERGNMSSPTVLFVLSEMLAAGVGGPWVAAAFGPGLAGEASLLVPDAAID